MPKLKLTAAAVERLKCPEKGQIDYFDEVLPSFGVRTSYNGAKSFFVMPRVNGKLIRLTVGRFPGVTLGEARSRAREAIELCQAGKDPRLLKQQAIDAEERRKQTTFGNLAAEFMARHVDKKLRPSTAREYRRILTGPDTRKLRKLPITDIQKHHVLSVIEGIEARGASGAADRALAYLRKFFNWCVERDVLERSPTERIRVERNAVAKDRVLNREEIRVVWQAFEAEHVFGPLFKLLLLTGQRRSEIAGMQWDELQDLDGVEPLLQLNGDRTKNKQAHFVPLSPQAVSLISELPRTSEMLFSTNGTTPVSGFGKAKARVDQWIAENHGCLPLWTLHDLRRTMVTNMNEELRIQPHVVEAIVNHVSGSAKRGVAGVYNRALYLDERRTALNAWANRIDNIVAGATAGNVVPIKEIG